MEKKTIYTYWLRHYGKDLGKWEYTSVARRFCDSDAQAELMVNHILDSGQVPTDENGRPREGLHIRHDGVEWFSRGA